MIKQLPQSSSSQCQLSKLIALKTHEKFNTLFKQKYKKSYQQSNMYTVICSISILNKQFPQKFEIITITNGTKSLPYFTYKQNKEYLLKDMHAQILGIKAFRMILLKELNKKQKSKYFMFDNKKGKFWFDTSRYQICMYSSEAPCGDCSVDQSQRLFSGGKPLKFFRDKALPDERFQKYILRTKPGRIDLPQNKRSLSLSCSDKLALYNIIGIQGKQLFKIVKPIYIDRFIVQAQPQQQIIIRKGLDFIHRLVKIKNMSTEIINRKIFNIVVDNKQIKITSQFKANQPQINCIQINGTSTLKDQEILVNNSKQTNKKINKQGFQVSLIFTQKYQEWINSKTGLPQGSSLSNYLKKGKVSNFCKKKFMQDFQKSGLDKNTPQNQTYKTFKNQMLINLKPSQQYTFKYNAIKGRIKLLFGIWTDNFKLQSKQ